ncbi:MAG: hemolysin family protein [Lachnospiraceae bacterium]|nr:hemolysin family protein [Lachnospiraceae bacterium]
MTKPVTGLLIWLLILVINAVLGAATQAIETIYSGKSGSHRLEEDNSKRALNVNYILEHHRSFITSMDLFMIILLTLSALVFFNMIFPGLNTWIEGFNLPGNGIIKALLLIVFIIFVLMFFEVNSFKIPRKAAHHYPEAHALFYGYFVRAIMALMFPMTAVIEAVSQVFMNTFHILPSSDNDRVTEEGILSIVSEGFEQGVVENDEAVMISNIFTLNDSKVKDVMTHRTNVIGVEASMTVKEALLLMLEENYSRYPVYEETLDNIVGIVHVKDAINYVINPHNKGTVKNNTADNTLISKLAHPAFFVPDTQAIDSLFKQMQSKKMHMAIAIDEYGQTAGIIAMEDILEEIVGEIKDEYDTEEELVKLNADGTVTANAMISLDDLKDQTGIDFTDTDFGTLNGLLVSELDHIPVDHEKFVLEIGDYAFDVLDTENKTITKVIITKLEKEEEAFDQEGNDEVSED